MSTTNAPLDETVHTWKTLLTKYIEKYGKKKTPQEQEEETTRIFMEDLKDNTSLISNKTSLPKFFFKNPTNFSELYLSVRTEAKQKFLFLKSYEIPSKKNLKDLFGALKENISAPKDGTERINYVDFKKVGEKCEMFQEYFRPSNFLKFDKDKYGRIEIVAFFHYVIKRNNVEEMKINLTSNDFYCEGYLIDKDLEQYIKKEAQNFPFYNDIEPEKQEFYLLVAQRKFFFYLDPKHKGKIYINDIVTSNILSEFHEMNESNFSTLSSGEIMLNWFSKENFERIYKKYIQLNIRENGMLSREELIKYGPGLTTIFIDRIFEEYQKYENAIDFKQFIDFVLAMENRKDPASIQYIWRAIDVYHKNAVDTFVINMFFRGVAKKLFNRNIGEYKIDDLKDEIWDMIKPKNQNYITLQDVLASPYGDIVLSLLIDAKSFFYHDKREFGNPGEFDILDDDYETETIA
jgi:serine/threonine-protein phosphatase 2A regulatory subunit B''